MNIAPSYPHTFSPSASSLFNGVYAGKRVLVTGHTGFKGSWLSLWLHELGAEVTGFALAPNTEPSHFDLIKLKDLIHHRENDIRDFESVQQAFQESKPEIVFHLAAQPLVRDSYDDPKTTFDTNIGGTVNVLEAIRHCPSVKAVVVVTSDKCYENKEWVWGYRENDPMGGHDPYSASKGAAEIVCAAYRLSFFSNSGDMTRIRQNSVSCPRNSGPYLGFATARAGNVIGGGDWAKDRLIPDCIRALSKGEPIIVRNPNAIRPWQHVLDPLSGYLLLAKRLLEDPDCFSGSWNFGPVENGQIKVIDLANKFVKAWGSGQIHTPPSEKSALHEAHILRLCIDRAVHELQWKPLLDSSAAIDWTVDWYKFWHLSDMDLRRLSLNQIRSFKKTQ